MWMLSILFALIKILIYTILINKEALSSRYELRHKKLHSFV